MEIDCLASPVMQNPSLLMLECYLGRWKTDMESVAMLYNYYWQAALIASDPSNIAIVPTEDHAADGQASS